MVNKKILFLIFAGIFFVLLLNSFVGAITLPQCSPGQTLTWEASGNIESISSLTGIVTIPTNRVSSISVILCGGGGGGGGGGKGNTNDCGGGGGGGASGWCIPFTKSVSSGETISYTLGGAGYWGGGGHRTGGDCSNDDNWCGGGDGLNGGSSSFMEYSANGGIGGFGGKRQDEGGGAGGSSSDVSLSAPGGDGGVGAKGVNSNQCGTTYGYRGQLGIISGLSSGGYGGRGGYESNGYAGEWGGPGKIEITYTCSGLSSCIDVDGDNYGTGNLEGCSGSTTLADCDDTLATGANKYPGNPETCDGKDNNCDGAVDIDITAPLIDCAIDRDEDFFGIVEGISPNPNFMKDICSNAIYGWCPRKESNNYWDFGAPNDWRRDDWLAEWRDDWTATTSQEDCDDDNPNNFPGNTEICDLKDNNCNNIVNENPNYLCPTSGQICIAGTCKTPITYWASNPSGATVISTKIFSPSPTQTVYLVLEYPPFGVSNWEFEIYDKDGLFNSDDEIRVGANALSGIVSGNKVIATWTITEEDIDNAGIENVYKFYFKVKEKEIGGGEPQGPIA